MAFQKITFKGFICSIPGENLIKTFITTAVNSNEQEAIYFKEKCPSIFGIDDEYLCSAIKYLEKAEKSYPNQSLFFSYCELSDDKFIETIKIANEKFPLDEVKKIQTLAGNYLGVLKICLNLITTLQRRKRFIELTQTEEMGKINDKSNKSIYLTIGKCYETAFEAFGEICNYEETVKLSPPNLQVMERTVEYILTRMQQAVIDFDEKKFSVMLFEYLVEKGFSVFLLTFHPASKHILSFLELKSKKDKKTASFAYSVYEKSLKYFEGAKLARFWAVIANGVSLEERHKAILKSQQFFERISNPKQNESNFNLVSKQYQIRIELQQSLLTNEWEEMKVPIDREVVPVEVLLKVAKGMKIYEICLKIFECNFVEDIFGHKLEKLWRHLIKELYNTYNEKGKGCLKFGEESNETAVRSKSKSFCQIARKLFIAFKGTSAMKLDSIVMALEEINLDKRHSHKEAIEFLTESGFSILDIANAYIGFIDQQILVEKLDKFTSNIEGNQSIYISVCIILESLYEESLEYKEPEIVEMFQRTSKKLAVIWRENATDPSSLSQRSAANALGKRLNRICCKLNVSETFDFIDVSF